MGHAATHPPASGNGKLARLFQGDAVGGVLAGSILSGVLGYIVLRRALATAGQRSAEPGGFGMSAASRT